MTGGDDLLLVVAGGQNVIQICSRWLLIEERHVRKGLYQVSDIILVKD